MMSSSSVSTAAAIALSLLLLAPATKAQDYFPGAPTFPNTVSDCNLYHTVVDGEGCWSITQTFGITLAQFYTWNPDITNDCGTNFWPGYAYCVGVGAAPPSSLSSVVPTCSCSTTGIASTTSTTRTSSTTTASGTTSSGTSSTGTASSGTTSSTVASNTEPYTTLHPITNYTIIATTVATTFPPSKTHAGQAANCIDWYLVSARDTCDSIVASNSWLTKAQLYVPLFIALTRKRTSQTDFPASSGIRPSTQTALGCTTAGGAGTASIPTVTGTYNPTTITPVDASFTALPVQDGIVSGCKAFYQAKDGDTCHSVVDGVYLTETDFYTWNPALNSVCTGLWVNYWYCVVGPNGITAMPPTVTIPPLALPPNQISTCNRWYQRDGESCAELAAIFGTFSEADFKAWNPNVGPTCSNLVDHLWYCVGIPGTPTTRSAPVQTTNVPNATPTQAGMMSQCSKLWLVGQSDSCNSIETANGITEAQFLQWNPALGTTSCALTRDYYVCVSVTGAAVPITTGATSSGTTTVTGSTTATGTSTKSTTATGTSSSTAIGTSTSRPASSTTATPATTTTATSTGGGPITTPTPIRAGMIAGCRRFYWAEDGDGCWAIANSAGINLNPAELAVAAAMTATAAVVWFNLTTTMFLIGSRGMKNATYPFAPAAEANDR
ncbi:hypothetical protein C8A05DRAFT_47667 [Staphylotrichum tortipilum]|uniref:LysM domain-containing protein n=1 Tax=Staphylotrichum tortipilum TaxID=2831512 RepID=A0AAN6MCC4_9PEZI|nr:hypothetical protein C8A05DRAFT_47667 [Staphylotrichum longicolle]